MRQEYKTMTLRILAVLFLVAGALLIDRRTPPQIPMSAAYEEKLAVAPADMIEEWRKEGLICTVCGHPFDRATEGNYQSCVCRD